MARVELLEEGLALVDSGPLYATIMVSKKGRPLSEVAIEGGRYALKILEQLAAFVPVIKKKAATLLPEPSYPQIVREMILAAQAINDPELTLVLDDEVDDRAGYVTGCVCRCVLCCDHTHASP